MDRIRILYIDDNPFDRELVRDALERDSDRFALTATGDRREFEERLRTEPFEVILSDFNILGYDGLQVLETVHALDPELPVILVTGTGSEEVAVEAMKRGAADYVLKSPRHIRRLPLTIEAVLRQVRSRQEQQKAAALSRRLTAILEATPDFVGIADREERVEYINRAGREMLGLGDDSDVTRLKIADCHPEGVTRLLREQGMPEAQKRGSWLGETALCTRDGEEIPVSQVFLAHLRDDGGVSHYSTVCRDIRELIRNREELKRLNRTLRVISRCNEALVRAREEQGLLQDIVDNLVELGGYPLAWVGFPRKEDQPDIRLAAQAGEDRGLLGHLQVADCPVKSCVHQTCLETSCRHLPLTERFADQGVCPHCQGLSRELGIRAAVSLPLPARDINLGCLVLYSREEHFEEEELKLLKELAEDLGFGIAALRTETAHRAAEESLRLHHRAIEASSNGIMICDALDPEMPILYVNPAFERITGYPAAEALGRNPYFLQRDDTGQRDLAALERALVEKREEVGVVRNYRRDGSLFWNEFSVAPVHDEAGKNTHFVGVINDITDRVRYQKELEHQATHDTLTGLANRNLLSDRIAQGIALSRRSGSKLAVLLLDLDRFKVINDSLGHDCGDELLRKVARRLEEVVRREDTVARMGGDEFVLVLSGLAEEEDLLAVTEKILIRLAEPVEIAGRPLQLTASAGVSLYPQDGDRPETLVRKADIAMYQAKEAGKNTFRFFSPEMNRRMVTAMELEADLRQALERDQLLIHFQPKVVVDSGKILGCEALIRWRHPQKGMISPVNFIPLAEETGLIEPIGTWVLREACAQNRSWQEQGLPPIFVSVNISARQFRGRNFEAEVAEILRETGLDPRWLKLELTESMLMHQPEEAALAMQRFREIGIGLCLDDFGTGFSSLNYLRRFPIDILKVDRSFISEVATDTGCAAVASSIVAIAHSLGMQVVAEGVETREQLEFLRGCLCDAFQGFLFSRPLPADEFARLLAAGASPA